MPSQGPFSPTTYGLAETAGAGTPRSDWSNLANIVSDNDTYAETTFGAPTLFDWSAFFYASGFGFTIPATATITGILLELQGYGGGAHPTFQGRMSATQALPASAAGALNIDPAPGSDSDTYQSLGGSNYRWEYSAPAGGFTPADINAAGFSAQIRATGFPGTQYVDHLRVTVYYTVPLSSLDVSAQASISDAQGTLDVTAVAAISNEPTIDVSCVASIGSSIFILQPALGDEVTSAEFTVAWILGTGGNQTDYRVLIYDDAALTNIVYDSGTVPGNATSHLVDGPLPNPETLYLTVTVTIDAPAQMTSSAVQFTTNFSTSTDVTGITAFAIGDHKNDPQDLPYILIRWTEIDPGALAFNAYAIYRRVAGTTAWLRIALITTVSTTSYKDHTCEPHVIYEYAVEWSGYTGGQLLVSAKQATPAHARNDFDFGWLHVVGDEAVYARVDSHQANGDLVQDGRLVQPWGRSAPTMHFGEALYQSYSLRLGGRAYQSINVGREAIWDLVQSFASAQAEGSILCLRLGRQGVRLFCVMRKGTRRMNQGDEAITIDVVENHYDEAV